MTRLLSGLFLAIAVIPGFSQSFKTEVDYLGYFSNQEQLISQRYLAYMSESAHGTKLRKVEQKRRDLLNALKNIQANTIKLKPYKGDTLLKKNYETYITILNNVFTEDYGKIVDLEEIAEQSYDQMEAFMLAEEKAGEKLNEASSTFNDAFKKYAVNNNIKLNEQTSKLGKKLGKMADANRYSHKIYLIFFKPYKQEAYMMDALIKKDVNGVEQNRGTLKKYTIDALAKIDTLRPFKSNQSLKLSARNYFQFLKNESDKMSIFADYLLKTEEFDKIKKAYEFKSQNERSQEEIDNYNKAVAAVNKTINTYNKQMQEFDKSRSQLLDSWNSSRKAFFEAYVPKE